MPPPAPNVEVAVHDDALVFPEPVPTGRVVFRLHNRGNEPHQLTLLLLEDDSPPISERLQQEAGAAPSYIAQVPAVEPGETALFAADLAEGRRYALVDLSQRPDGTLRGRLGVARELRLSLSADNPEASP